MDGQIAAKAASAGRVSAEREAMRRQLRAQLDTARTAYQALRYGPESAQTEAQQQQLDRAVRGLIKALRRRRPPPAG